MAMTEADPAPDKDIRKILPTQSQVFFFGILALMVFLTWILFKPFIIYMVAGVLVAVLALPIDRLWEKILPNRIAAFGTLFTVFILLTAPIVGLGFALAKDVNEAVGAIQEGKLDEYAQDIAKFLMPGSTSDERNETIRQVYDEQIQPFLLAQGQKLAKEAGGFLVDLGIAITIILFVVYYVLTDGHKLVAYLRRAAPLPAKQVDFLLEEAHNGLHAVFFGQILTSLIQGGLGGVAFLVAGVPGAVLWAGVMAILSLLPVVGAFLVWIPAAFYLFLRGDIGWAIFMVGWGVIVISQVDNFIRPKLIGNRADIHPLFVLVGVLGGVAAFGFMGLFLGPLLVGITVSVLKVWEAEYLDPRLVGHADEEPEAHAPKRRRGKSAQ